METIIRTIGLFIFAVICFRLMGYRSFGDMEPIDYVIVLGIAEILGAPLADSELNIINAYIAIGVLTSLQIIFSYISLKNVNFRTLIEGNAITVIKEGKILKTNMRKARFNYTDLMEELRLQGLNTVQDVELANLETSGRFSIIKKKEVEPITPRYLGMKTSITLVDNGQVIPEKLEQAGITPARLSDILFEFNITDLNDVEMVVLSPSGNFAVTKKSIPQQS